MRRNYGLLLGPAVDTKALMRRHRAAMSLLADTTEQERVRLLTMVVAPGDRLREAIDSIDDRLADGHEAVNFNLVR